MVSKAYVEAGSSSYSDAGVIVCNRALFKQKCRQ
jgi:hypothetical protein